MKKLLILFMACLSLNLQAQDKEKVQASKGVVYGSVSKKKAAISPDEIQNKLVENKFKGKVKGKVAEVCKAEGCWIRLMKADGSTLMVKAKDHKFFMPENIVGKTVLIEGEALVKEVSEETRKHYAEDAGLSKAEIAKIKGSEKNVQFAAKGVKVLD